MKYDARFLVENKTTVDALIDDKQKHSSHTKRCYEKSTKTFCNSIRYT